MASEYLFATSLDDLKPGAVTAVQVEGRFLAFYIVDGAPYCTEDKCTHEGLPMSSGGHVDGDEIECPWHWSKFNVKTGEATSPPAALPLRTFPVEVRDGRVYVAFDQA